MRPHFLHVEKGRPSPILFADQTLSQGLFLHSFSLPVIIRNNSVKVDIGVLLDLHQKHTVRVSLKTIPLRLHDQPFQFHISTMGNFLSFFELS